MLLLVTANINWGSKAWPGMLESDAKGYYAYLPAVFIYHDLNFGFFDKIEKQKYYNPNLQYDYRATGHGSIINKYYCGTAIAQLPFFLSAHALTLLTGADADGYSKLYMFSVSLAALFYLLLGLYFLNKLLLLYEVKEKHRALLIAMTALGTHAFNYAVVEPGMSHIYSFAFVCLFMYVVKLFFIKPTFRYAVFASLLLGIVVLIRPVNVLLVFVVFFLAGSSNQLMQGLRYLVGRGVRSFFLPALVLGVASVQLIIYKLSTGAFIVYSYEREGFHFLTPHMWDILFSYRKGLFLYTPVLLLSMPALFFLWKRSRYEVLTWLSFFLLITYIFSSWWMWFYGGSFSSRVYVEFIPLFIVPVGLWLSKMSSLAIKRVVVVLLFLFLLLNQIQTFQYRYYQIHYSDMTKEKYWDVFLRVDKL